MPHSEIRSHIEIRGKNNRVSFINPYFYVRNNLDIVLQFIVKFYDERTCMQNIIPNDNDNMHDTKKVVN